MKLLPPLQCHPKKEDPAAGERPKVQPQVVVRRAEAIPVLTEGTG
jgi:hypothetical protein